MTGAHLETWPRAFDDEAMVIDSELTAFALAGDPDAPLDDGAIPLELNVGWNPVGTWYMPPIGKHRLSGWRRVVVVSIIVTLLVLEALGLCSVFGQVVIG